MVKGIAPWALKNERLSRCDFNIALGGRSTLRPLLFAYIFHVAVMAARI